MTDKQEAEKKPAEGGDEEETMDVVEMKGGDY